MMVFLENCLIGYRILAFFVIVAIGLISAIFPILLICESEDIRPISLYIIVVPIIAGCISLIQLL